MAEVRMMKADKIETSIKDIEDDIEKKFEQTQEEVKSILTVLSEMNSLHKESNECMKSLYMKIEKSDKVLKDVKNSFEHTLEQYVVDRITVQNDISDIKLELCKILHNHNKEIDTIILAQINIQKILEENDETIITMKNQTYLELEKTRNKMQTLANRILIGMAGSLGVIGGLLITLINIILNMG